MLLFHVQNVPIQNFTRANHHQNLQMFLISSPLNQHIKLGNRQSVFNYIEIINGIKLGNYNNCLNEEKLKINIRTIT